MRSLLILLLAASAGVALAAPKQVRVFVALCDNKTQGIVPVGAKIGNGDDPDANLYWGCSDGFGAYFRRSKQWKVTRSEHDVSETILRRLTLKHAAGDIDLIAEAYRGSEMRKCLEDFERTASSEKWKSGGSPADIRMAAAAAYASNQKISVRAAAGVFALPVKPAEPD